ncbi:MAG TPA: glycosyltransferase family 39 protein [Steroidobacteraceae bacterium]
MLMIFVEMLAATPDTPSIAASAMFLWALAKLDRTENRRWWLAAGVAAGLALLSKYTAFFLGAGTLAWMLFSPRGRRWFASPWIYVAGALALLIFLPNVLWENAHHWATFAFQLSRVTHGGFTLRFLFEFLGVQLLFASPFIFALAALSMAFSSRARDSHVFLLAALVAPSAIYFLVHSLHDRIQGNWPSFLYPMVALAAAEAFCRTDWQGWTKPVWRVSRAAAVPVAAAMVAAVNVQALLGVIPAGRSDPLARLLAVGFGDVTKTVSQTQRGIQAGAIVTTDYESTAWLNFYMPAGTRIMQVGETYRYPDSPVPDPGLLGRPMLYVAEAQRDRSRALTAQFSQVQEIARFDRLRHGVPVAHMVLYRLSGPKETLAARLP